MVKVVFSEKMKTKEYRQKTAEAVFKNRDRRRRLKGALTMKGPVFTAAGGG